MGGRDRRAAAVWFALWAALLAWSNLDKGSSPLDASAETLALLIFGIVPQYLLGVIAARWWVVLCPLILMVGVSLVAAVAWEEETGTGEGPIGVIVLWAFAIPASAVIASGVATRVLARRRNTYG